MMGGASGADTASGAKAPASPRPLRCLQGRPPAAASPPSRPPRPARAASHDKNTTTGRIPQPSAPRGPGGRPGSGPRPNGRPCGPLAQLHAQHTRSRAHSMHSTGRAMLFPRELSAAGHRKAKGSCLDAPALDFLGGRAAPTEPRAEQHRLLPPAVLFSCDYYSARKPDGRTMLRGGHIIITDTTTSCHMLTNTWVPDGCRLLARRLSGLVAFPQLRRGAAGLVFSTCLLNAHDCCTRHPADGMCPTAGAGSRGCSSSAVPQAGCASTPQPHQLHQPFSLASGPPLRRASSPTLATT